MAEQSQNPSERVCKCVGHSGVLPPPGAVLFICKKKFHSSSCSVPQKSFPPGRRFSEALTKSFLSAGKLPAPSLHPEALP